MNTELLFTQRLLKAQGIYSGALDGLSGPATAAALAEVSHRSIEIAVRLGRFDERSEANIVTLHLAAQDVARVMLNSLKDKMGPGIVVKVISGTRTYAEQDALYAKGRTADGSIVTKARGGESNHNFGIAWDIGIFDHGSYLGESQLYAVAAKIAISAAGRDGFEWGGNWVTMKDMPHFQLTTGFSIKETRARFETGRDYVTPA